MKEWHLLDFTTQMCYVRQAEYLIEKGYAFGDAFVLAKRLYENERKK